MCNLISFGFMFAADLENESLNYFSNKYPNLECAWTTGEERQGLTSVQLSMQRRKCQDGNSHFLD